MIPTTVICTIQVIAMHFMSKADVIGHTKSQSNTHYLVDFSVDAKRQGFEGDYSNRIVNKSDCIKLNK